MQNEDNLENEIRDLGHLGSAETRQLIFGEVRRSLGENQEQQAAGGERQIGRKVMQSRMIKYPLHTENQYSL